MSEDEIRNEINEIAQSLGYGLNDIFVTDDGDVLATWDIQDMQDDDIDLPQMRTANEWYAAQLTA